MRALPPSRYSLAAVLGLALLLPACGGESPAGSLEIRALAGPTCPVETVPPDPACAPKPIAVRVAVLDANDHRVATITTRVDGPVHVPLDPGRYRLVGVDPGPPIVEEQPVTVATAPVAVTIGVDTGIR
jgi:hypothetical protein